MIKRLKKRSLDGIERLALRTTHFIGSTESLIIHTILFIVSFILYFFGIPFEQILLVVTTIVSLEAIYLSIFIQMSVNRQYRKLHAVARDVDEIQENVEDIQEDIDEIQKDVDEIQEDVEDIEEEKPKIIFEKIEKNLQDLVLEISELKKKSKKQNNK